MQLPLSPISKKSVLMKTKREDLKSAKLRVAHKEYLGNTACLKVIRMPHMHACMHACTHNTRECGTLKHVIKHIIGNYLN